MRYAFFALLLFIFSAPAKAQQLIVFNTPESFREKEITNAYKEEVANDFSLLIAKADLNDDFIDEYILKPAQCSEGQICSHGIMAYMAEKPLLIGRFDAHKITIGFKKDYGVRRLIVYNQAYNDFTSQQARWDPYNFQYNYPENEP